MVTLDAKKEGGRISISEASFEHLLSCLDNQKFLHDINADATTCNYKEVQWQNQEAIDDFNKQCRAVLHNGNGGQAGGG